MQQRPADRLAVADLLRLVRQARGAQQVLEQDVGRVAALEGFARGQLHQQQHVAGAQQLQGEAWRWLDRLLLLRRNLRGRDRLGLLRLGHDDAQLRFFRANRRHGWRRRLLRRSFSDRCRGCYRLRRLGLGLDERLQQLRPRRCGKGQFGTRQPAGHLHGIEVGPTPGFADQTPSTCGCALAPTCIRFSALR